MHILTDPTAPTVDGALALTIRPRDLGELAGRLHDGDRPVLYLDPGASLDDQLRCLEEAARYLRTGDRGSAHPIRHLSVVRA